MAYMADQNGGAAELTAAQVRLVETEARELDEHLKAILQSVEREEQPPVAPAAVAPQPASIESLMSRAGRSFLRAFAGSLVVMLTGLLAAPNLANGATGVTVAAVIASIVAGLRAVQEFIPQISLEHYWLSGSGKVAKALAPYVDSFVRAFVGALVTSWIGILAMPALSFDKSLVVAASIGVLTAIVRGLQAALDKNSVPFKGKGIPLPVK